MITVVVVDTSRLDTARLDIGKEFPVLLDMSEPRGAERACAYIALSRCYKELYGEAMPPIRFSEDGKPYIEGGVAINLSHRDKIVALAFATAGGKASRTGEPENNPLYEKIQKLDTPPNIGVDIEWVMDGVRARHLFARYASHFGAIAERDILPSVGVTYLLAELDECGNFGFCGGATSIEEAVLPRCKATGRATRETTGKAVGNAEDITLMWTSLEATLKASGGGFRDLKRLGDILPYTYTECAMGELGGRRFSLSVAALFSEDVNPGEIN